MFELEDIDSFESNKDDCIDSKFKKGDHIDED